MFSSTPSSFRLLVAAALVGATAATAACSMSASTTAASGESAPLPDDRGEAGATTNIAEDAATSKGDTYRGNPLCHVTPMWCMPDDAVACADPAADGGTADAATAVPDQGCRLALGAGTTVPTPSCRSATPAGVDGASCSSGADCAPRFDCVEGDKGSVCRRYCCLDTCGEQTSQNGGATFCDVQKLVDTNQKAPVCMPLKRCKLLTQGECAANETCAVVDETGDTGCVGVGPAQVGQSCDETHCASGLTCLGQAGNRKCYQLCRVNGTACGPSQVCKTSTVFKDMTIGVCTTP